jgi:hypothetical protein
MKPRGRDEDGTAEQVELEHAGNTGAVRSASRYQLVEA